MKKRIAAALLWFYTAWYAWTFVAHLLGASELAGPVLGAAVAALIAGDPFRRVWTRSTATIEPAGAPGALGARQAA